MSTIMFANTPASTFDRNCSIGATSFCPHSPERLGWAREIAPLALYLFAAESQPLVAFPLWRLKGLRLRLRLSPRSQVQPLP